MRFSCLGVLQVGCSVERYRAEPPPGVKSPWVGWVTLRGRVRGYRLARASISPSYDPWPAWQPGVRLSARTDPARIKVA